MMNFRRAILRWLYPLNEGNGRDAPPLDLDRARRRMLNRDLRGRGIRDQRVLAAMARVAREQFLPPQLAAHAYDDNPLEIGHGQTISQPYIVARMSELLEVRPGHRVLEIGGGCGYQSAILLELGAEVFIVEIVPELARAIAPRLAALGYRRFHVSCHDGRLGWPEQAPFDGILVAAAAPRLPEPLKDQACVGGRILAPIGGPSEQMLQLWRRLNGGFRCEETIAVRFVPLTGGGEVA